MGWRDCPDLAKGDGAKFPRLGGGGEVEQGFDIRRFGGGQRRRGEADDREAERAVDDGHELVCRKQRKAVDSMSITLADGG